MNKMLTFLLVPALALSTSLTAQEAEEAQLQARQNRAEYQAMAEEAERTRVEAESVRAEAIKAAEMARHTTQRLRAERTREATEGQREDSAERAQERALEEEGLARAREELGKAHRELRKATQEVARAHRDLSQVKDVHRVVRHVNLGDRAVIGAVLGSQSNEGVEIIGISPDGPAERAGLQQGDILVSIRGVELVDNERAREVVFEVMRETGDGEELAVVVERDGDSREYVVTAETREPRGWQSVIRIPEIEVIEEISGIQTVIVERIEVPDIDEEALAERMAELTIKMENMKHNFVPSDGGPEQHYEYEFSDLGGLAMGEANVWFGLHQAHGLELAPINEGLGSYFKTDRGVLVISARDNNAYQLEPGDVVLSVDSTDVNSPSDMMRALRDVEPGSKIELEIMRDRRDRKFQVTMPENRLGYR
jgi:C-terminal processing protease CtpA/Prc